MLSDTPMDVLFNSMAVTFLYNLDDIDGEMGFLGAPPLRLRGISMQNPLFGAISQLFQAYSHPE